MYKCEACGYEGDYCCEQEYIGRLDMDGNIVHGSKKCCPRCSEHKGFIEKQE